MLAFFLSVAVGLLGAALSGAALAFDGSYYLFSTIENLVPMAPNRREVHRLLLQAPLFASHYTSDVGLLQAIMGISYALAPFLALLLAWWMVRDRAPGMFVWAALGILIAPLPGQFTFISEGAIVVQFAWALFLGALLGFRRREWLPAALAGALIFFSHPYAFVLFGLAALLALVPARSPARRRDALATAALLALVAALAAWRFFSGMSDYEAGQISIDVFQRRFFSALVGLPLAGLLCALLAGWLVVLRERRRSQVRLLLLAGVAFAVWAAIPALWQDILSFRFFLLPVLFPFVLLAALDTARPGDLPWAERRSVIRMVGGVFAATLLLQSLAWFNMMGALRDATMTSLAACLSTPTSAEGLPPQAGPRLDWLWPGRAAESGTLDWVYHTPINHWSITALALMVQGNTPHTLVLPDGGCEKAVFEEGLPLAPWEVRGWSARHFDFEPLRERLMR